MRASFALICAWTVPDCPGLARIAAAAERNTAAAAAAANSITGHELKRHVEVLADDSFEGREAGSRGGHAAGIYLRKEMVQHRLEPLGTDGDYFQYFQGRYRNVLGMIRGSDADLMREVILVGAHYDHVGYGRATNSFGPLGYIHNGADDNASGTAGLLELMEAFGRLAEPPRRSVVFAFWDGEEKGLLGSWHYVSNPSIPLTRTRLFVNLDMIGRLRGDDLTVHGARTGFGLRQLVARANRAGRLALHFNWEIKDNSDHYPFYQRQVPFVMLHTGLHDDYHSPRDDVEKVNVDGMQHVTRLLFNLVYEAANRDDTTQFRSAVRHESDSTRQQLERPRAVPPARLGVSWDPQADAQDGVLVSRVRAGSAAAAAGIRRGDRVVRVAEHQIVSGPQLRAAIVRAATPTLVIVQRDGEESPLFLNVHLRGRAYRIGLSWHVDDAEPNSVFVTRVIPGSAADHAGLKYGDRIYEINGRPLAGSDRFYESITSQTGSFDLLVERAGRLLNRRIQPSTLVAADANLAGE
jgi:hypothetical protein